MPEFSPRVWPAMPVVLRGVAAWLAHALLLPVALTAALQPQGEPAVDRHEAEIQSRLCRGWNTWDSRSVLAHVLLPECFCINLAFKQVYWLDEKYLATSLIGRQGDGAEVVRPGPHAFDGSYSRLEIVWEHLHASIETATDDTDLVVLVTPLDTSTSPVRLIVESGMLWNRTGTLVRSGSTLVAHLPRRTIPVYGTRDPIEDPYVPTRTPYLVFPLDGPTGLSSGHQRSLKQIRAIIERKRAALENAAGAYGDLAEAFVAVQSGISWNTIYEPRLGRIISTVGRLWNQEYGGYCTFGWDNFFLAYMTSLFSKDLAYANAIEHLRGKTDEGFIPNDNRGNGSKSWDRSQPPVGAIMVKEIYKRFPERWFLEATFPELLAWNRWWITKRMNEGLLSYGSHRAKNPFGEPDVHSKTAAGYESGMDDSPMYAGVPFNGEKNTLELQDVGLNSLYLADCLALAEMADVLGKKREHEELQARADTVNRRMGSLWDEKAGLYLNRRTDTQTLSYRLSPTLFYPLLARLPDSRRAERMIRDHLLNPTEFYGQYMIPSIARNDSLFPRQRYWKGAIWPPLNFLTYLGLRNYGLETTRRELVGKSLDLFLSGWRQKGYVRENYSAILGSGDDPRLSSDRFHSWGALLGFIAFIEQGFMAPTEGSLK